MTANEKTKIPREKIQDTAKKLFPLNCCLGAPTRGLARVAGTAGFKLFRHISSKEYLFEKKINSTSFPLTLRDSFPGITEDPHVVILRDNAEKFPDTFTILKVHVSVNSGRSPEAAGATKKISRVHPRAV